MSTTSLQRDSHVIQQLDTGFIIIPISTEKKQASGGINDPGAPVGGGWDSNSALPGPQLLLLSIPAEDSALVPTLSYAAVLRGGGAPRAWNP